MPGKHGKMMHSLKQGEITTAIYEAYKNDVGIPGQFALWQLRGAGVCMGCAAYYLIDRLVYHGDYWSWLADIEAKWEVVSQYLSADYSLLPPMDAQQRLQEEIKTKGLRHIGTLKVEEGELSADTLADALWIEGRETIRGRLCFLTESDGSQRGHAIAMIKYDNPRLMDPNFGEVKFRSWGAFSAWLADVYPKQYAIFDEAHINFYDV